MSSLVRVVVRDEIAVDLAKLGECNLVGDTSQAIRERSKSIADHVILMGLSHLGHTEGDREESFSKVIV